MPIPPSLAQLDIDPAEIGRHHPVEIGIVADARLGLGALLRALPEENRSPWWTRPEREEPWQLPGIDVLGPLERAWPSDAILSADVTRLAYIAMAEFPLGSMRSFLHPAGAVAMGYAIPAALGAKAAYPDRKVLALVGDGGFQMSALELATAMQEKLPIVVLLINDNCLTLIKSTQQRRYDNRFIAVHFENPDFEMLARSFGVQYARAKNETELEGALSKAFGAETTTLIEVRPADRHHAGESAT